MTITMSNSRRRAEAEHILEFGRSGDSPYLVHLQSPFSVANYQRIADRVARLAKPAISASVGDAPRVLDWGAGYGQVSYLMANRGLDVTSYDVGTAGTFPLQIDDRRRITRGDQQSALPFSDAAFDVVLSCGVLEHVPAEEESLAEIQRVLRAGGLFIVFNLPQRGGYTEFIVRLFKLGYTHERRYTVRGTTTLLARHGLRVRNIRRSNILPHNFRGLPAPIRLALTSRADALLRVDLAVSSVPVLNLACGILELVAERVP